MSRIPATSEGLRRILAMAHCELPPRAHEQLWQFHQLLRERNEDGDLTRLRAFETMAVGHYVDCILVARKLAELPSPLLDIGSGAGFPGIPLKIARPEVQIVSSEGRARRVAFQQEAIELLGLEGFETFHGRTFSTFPKPVRGVITRALERIPVTLARVRAFVPPGGLAIFMKGPHCDDEIAEAKRDFGTAWRLRDDIAYELPLIGHGRRLVTFERLEDPAELARRKTRSLDSEQNDGFKLLKSLLEPKGVRKAGLALLAGHKLVPELLRDFPARVVELVVERGTEAVPSEAPPELPVTVLRPELFRQLDVAGTRAPLAVVRADDPAPWDGQLRGCTLAVPFQDPENVGAVLRTAAALGVAQVVLAREAASPWHPKALRAGGTAAFRLELRRGGPLAELATVRPLLALSAEGRPIDQVQFVHDFMLLPGLEGVGLPDALRAEAVSIPMAGGSESLNAAAATAIALYVWSTAAQAPLDAHTDEETP
jgi:16S rRNA (guanine527-N7)-methyltransferase